MKAFTLFELVITLFILAMLFGIAFRSPVFQKAVYYLPQELARLSHFLRLAQDVSFTESILSGKKLCAVGLLFQQNQYAGVAHLSSEEDCEFLAKIRPLNFTQINAYLLEDGSLSLDSNHPLRIKQTFAGRLTVNQADCLTNLTEPVLLLFTNPYGEPLVFFSQAGNWRLQTDWPICLSLKYRNETRKIKINRFGQIILQ